MLKLILTTALAHAAMATDHPLSAERFEAIQGSASRTWETVEPHANKFAGWDAEDIKSLMGTQLPFKPEEVSTIASFKRRSHGLRAAPAGSLPDSFDARTKFASCKQDIRDQAHCGSCWAVAAAETLSDNLCIAGQGDVKLSAQDLVSCDTADHGCHGGTLPSAWKYLVSSGLVSDSCLPYTSGDGNVTKCHPGECSDPSGEYAKHKCASKSNFLSDTNDIKNGVMQMGSAETGFYVYEDFMHYKSGVYKHDNTTGGDVLGGHAVRIIGWGKDAVAGEYWLVANSWGTSWGMDGYFKIAFDDKESGFALGGGFNCGDLSPAPPGPAPGPSPAPTCKDIMDKCSQFKNECAAIHGECMETCGCCKEFDKPKYCSNGMEKRQVTFFGSHL
jgi:cathepsin B